MLYLYFSKILKNFFSPYWIELFQVSVRAASLLHELCSFCFWKSCWIAFLVHKAKWIMFPILLSSAAVHFILCSFSFQILCRRLGSPSPSTVRLLRMERLGRKRFCRSQHRRKLTIWGRSWICRTNWNRAGLWSLMSRQKMRGSQPSCRIWRR